VFLILGEENQSGLDNAAGKGGLCGDDVFFFVAKSAEGPKTLQIAAPHSAY
jgi:hypothetical protein